MKRSDLTKVYIEKNKERLKKFFNEEKGTSSNPALLIHETIEERPYSVNDFKRKEFHMDLIGKD